jgi:long-chain acyl-CoA synthetase
VATQKVDILPVWIEGTHRAFPKGAKLPSPTARNLKVFIGKPIDADRLLEESKEMGTTERYKHISASAQRAVEALRDRDVAREKKRGLDLSELFTDLQNRFSPDSVDSPLSFYFSLGQLDSSKWTVMVDARSCSVHMGKPPAGKADCVVKTSPEIFRKIVEEAYAPSVEEFMTGAIKTNALELLQQFPSAFQLGAPRD